MTLYIPPHFGPGDPRALDRLIDEYPFGTLVTRGAEGLLVSHVPFIAERSAGGTLLLQGHLARANSHWEALAGADELAAIFQGPHAYVSPGWYVNHPAVPTWNYAVVHARGRARLLDEAELHDLVIRLSDRHEAGRADPWRAAALPPDYAASMLRAIVGFEIAVERLEGKFKLSQNRPAEAGRVADALEREAPDLAAFMRAHLPPGKG